MDSPRTPADVTKTPIDNLMQILSGLSAGHEKALKQGIYNAVALFLLCMISAAGYGLYVVLGPFLKPLVWALLCGSVLFPFKLSLTSILRRWFANTESSHKPLLVCFAVLPVRIFNDISDLVGGFLLKYLKYILGILGSLLGLLTIYRYTPNFLIAIMSWSFELQNGVLSFCIERCNLYVISAILIGYLSTIFLYWTPETSNRYRAYCVWFVVSLFLSNVLSSGYPILFFCSLQLLFCVGLIYEVALIYECHRSEGNPISFTESIKLAFGAHQHQISISPTLSTVEEEDLTTPDPHRVQMLRKPMLKVTGRSMSMNLDMKKVQRAEQNARRVRSVNNIFARMSITDHYLLSKLRAELRMSLDLEDSGVDSAKYMYGAMYACIGMILWKNLWFLCILIVPMSWYCLKQLNSYCGFSEVFIARWKTLFETVENWCLERHDALLPVPVRGLYKVGIIVDNRLTHILKGSIDTVTTTAVILTLVVVVICGSIFITIQIYAEGLHLVQVTGEILNSTLISNPDIDWVPQQWEESVNSVLDNAYTYGRSAISDSIRKFLKDLEPSKADQLEKKVLELWDRLYQSWMMSGSKANIIGPTVDAKAAYSVWESIQEGFGKSIFQIFNMSSLQNFARENIGILLSVLDSLWSIVKGNMSVVLSIVTELLYVVLMSGSAVLNFTLSMVVFFTALFYLLNSSEKSYKPIELITNFGPIGCHRPDEKGFAVALQESVIGVFTATFKLASFFGMWTWFSHNLFQVKVVYLPSVLATVLGAVPFLDAYFACLPATLELWFTQGSVIAVVFFLFHFIPCNIVVTEFYKDIKGGGHPYLTGLSIAGGVFCLGIEGAIFGPLLLCCIMVAINLSRRYLQGSPSEETINTIKSQIYKL